MEHFLILPLILLCFHFITVLYKCFRYICKLRKIYTTLHTCVIHIDEPDKEYICFLPSPYIFPYTYQEYLEHIQNLPNILERKS